MECISRAHRLAVLVPLAPMIFIRPAAAQSSPDTVSAPITNVRYEVTFSKQFAEQRRIGVAMTFGVTGAGPVVLSLPAWTPGAYEISNFARWVVNFAATSDLSLIHISEPTRLLS